MQISLPLVKQIALGYYSDHTRNHVLYLPLDDRTERLTRECKSEIRQYEAFPGNARTRVIARATRQLNEPQFDKTIDEFVQFLESITKGSEFDNLIPLVEEAISSLRAACPSEFKSISSDQEFNGVSIATFDFIDFVIDGGVRDTLDLKYATPEAIIQNTDQIYEDTEHNLYRGLNPKTLTSEKLRLKENPELLDAARCGFLELDCADELIDFAVTILNLRYLIIKKLWKEKEDEAKRLIAEGFNEAVLIARDRLLEGFDESKSTRSKHQTGEEYKNQVNELGKISLGRDPMLSEIPLDRKIEFCHSFKRNIILIAQTIQDEENTTSQISTSIQEMCAEFNIIGEYGIYHTITKLFGLINEMRFLIPQMEPPHDKEQEVAF